MKSATMLYKLDGPFEFEGESYETIVVEAEDVPDYLKEGWSKHPNDCGIDTVSAPTRDELEQKASELNIKVSARMKDETIAAKIEEALKDK